jgi:hypothetical protein
MRKQGRRPPVFAGSLTSYSREPALAPPVQTPFFHGRSATPLNAKLECVKVKARSFDKEKAALDSGWTYGVTSVPFGSPPPFLSPAKV